MKNISIGIILLLLLVGCTTRPTPVPQGNEHKLPWGAVDLDINSKGKFTIHDSMGTTITQKANRYKNKNGKVPFNILALSGGGSRGAFGTGLLNGWADRGDIPKFDIVTGISTGAVMAPFIFLSDEHLEEVKYFYTKMHTKDVFEHTWLNFFNGYIMNANPLREHFKKTFDKDFLDKVALEHKKGRRLYIGTTNIDTGQLTVWDMGAIASSNRADKYERFCNIIYASTAMPVYLPPQYMKVEVDNQDYYQMHVDGGIHSQVFMVGILVNWKDVLEFEKTANTNFDVTLYTIANRKYRQRDIYKSVEQSPGSIIEAYVLTEMDLLFDRSTYRLYDSCKDKGFKFRMAAIPTKKSDIVINPLEFNPDEMLELYNKGYKTGNSKKIEWKDKISLDEYDNNI